MIARPRPAPNDNLERAKEAALRLLSYRARSEEELRQRLAQKGYAAGTVRRVIAELRRVDLVNDRQFAESWVESRLAGRRAGRRGLLWELIRKGLDRDLAGEIVDRRLPPEAETVAAKALADEFLAREGAEPKSLARLHRLLVRRGFSPATVAEVLSRRQT